MQTWVDFNRLPMNDCWERALDCTTGAVDCNSIGPERRCIYERDGTVNSSWDTHFNHFERLKGELLPGLDRALSSLILDLEQRGMLDDTLVACLTEHGRTPKLHPKPRGVGREHRSQAYSVVLAGGGVPRGKVIGESDRQGGFVTSDPVSPKEILATMYHLLGIDHTQQIPDHLNRPVSLVPDASVLESLLG